MNKVLQAIALLLLSSISISHLIAQDLQAGTQNNLGPNVNSSSEELGPLISPDGKYLFFIRQGHESNTLVGMFKDAQDIWFSEQANGEWSPAIKMGSPFNENRYNSVEDISLDGLSLYVRGAYNPDGGVTKGFSKSNFITEQGWSTPVPLQIAEFNEMSKGRYSGLEVSSDEKVLLIQMSEKEGSEECDLYVSFLIPDSLNSYTKPVKIGNTVNTGSDEFAHFLASDDRTLYFSSDRKDKNALGGKDIYVSRRLDDSWLKWSEPVNLGPEVNTTSWDAYFTLDAKGQYAYLVTEQNAEDKSDIVRIELKKEVRPTPVTLVSGKFLDLATNEELQVKATYRTEGSYDRKKVVLDSTNGFKLLLPANVKYIWEIKKEGYEMLIDTLVMDSTASELELQRNFLIKKLDPDPILTIAGYVSDAATSRAIRADIFVDYYPTDFQNQLVLSNAITGAYEAKARAKDRYTLRVSAPGYVSVSETLPDLKDKTEASSLVKNFKLKSVVSLKNQVFTKLYFETASASLNNISQSELKALLSTLKNNPNVKIEIAGHADSRGEASSNNDLSLKRALAVYDYLVARGISPLRVKTRGYGTAQPASSNNSAQGMEQNRRVEIKIVE